MKINRRLQFQLIALLIVAATSLAGCKDAGSNRREGVDAIPVVSTSHIAIHSAVDYQVVVQDRGM